MYDLKNKRILIAGGSGFIGSHLISALQKRGVPKENIFAPRSKECNFIVREDCAKAVKDVDVVFDCAAVPGDILLREKIPGKLFYEILVMGINLLDVARQGTVEKIVTIGSATEYPDTATAPFKEEYLWDGLPSLGNIPYGLSRRVVEMQGEMYRRESGFNSIHVILTNTYGPGERFESGYMIPSLMNKILGAKTREEKDVEAWGTGRAIRDLVFVEDAIEGILLAAELYDEALPLNIGSGVGISIKEIVTLLCDLASFKGAVRWDANKPEGALMRILDTSRASKLIGFKTKTTLEKGFKETIDWHISQSTK